MNKVLSISSLVMWLVLLTCKSLGPDSNASANNYYKDISMIMQSTVQPSTEFSNYFQYVAPLAKKNLNYQLRQNQIDSLHGLYVSFTSTLALSIKKLSEIGEFDTSFHLSKLSTDRLNSIKDAYDSTIPIYLQVYTIGLKEASALEIERLNTAPDILHRGNSKSEDKGKIFDFELKRFIDKYGIHY